MNKWGLGSEPIFEKIQNRDFGFYRMFGRVNYENSIKKYFDLMNKADEQKRPKGRPLHYWSWTPIWV